jgi:predicted peptidase
MGKTLQLFLLILLLLPSCQKDEEILPLPPRSEETAPAVAPEEFIEEVRPSIDVDSDLYQSAVFGDMPYRILIPRNYDSTKTYPLHVFLHGIGERGTDNERQLSVGGDNFQADSIREKYPAFVVFPQCPITSYWFSNNMVRTLGALIDTLVSDYFVDEDNISIGGYSMGAYGTFEMVAHYPRLFKAALAISGDGDEEQADGMAKPTWQIFAGLKDQVVPSSRTEKMAKALVRAGASVSFKLYPNADHRGAWESAFSEPDLFSKLFDPKKEDIFEVPPQEGE